MPLPLPPARHSGAARPAAVASLLLVAAALLAPSPSAIAQEVGGASWSVGPVPAADGTQRGNYDLALNPGDVVSDGFRIRNDGAAPLVLDVYAADAYTTREGSLDLPPAGTPSVDSGLWIALDEDSVALDPGQEAIVPFTITVPADASPGDHPAGIVAALRTTGDGQVAVDRRLGSRINLRVDGPLLPGLTVGTPEVRFSGTWAPLGVGDVEVVYEVENTGNTRVTGTAAITTAGLLGLGATASPAEQLVEIVPGSTVEMRQTLSGVAALGLVRGELIVAGESVGIGMRSLDPSVLPFQLVAVPAIPLLVLGGVALVALLVVVLVRRRTRRRRTGTAGGEAPGSAEAPPAEVAVDATA